VCSTDIDTGAALAARSIKPDEMEFVDGRIQVGSDVSRRVSLADLMRASHIDFLEVEASAKPLPERSRHSSYSPSAVS